MPRTQRLELAYGRAPLPVEVPADAEVLRLPPPPPPPAPLDALLSAALEEPVGSPRLRDLARAGNRVTLVVSDRTRDEPRAAMITAILRELRRAPVPPASLRLAVANGTHTPSGSGSLDLPQDILGAFDFVDHDGRDEAQFVSVGETRRGTRVRYPRWLLESDLVIATGRIRPHYFAGFGAGAKAIFPGLGHAADIRRNHQLKSDPTARLGRVEGNACRDDMEEAARLLPVRTFLLNVVTDDAGEVQAVVSGDLVAAHRAGVARCRPFCEVEARHADIVIVSDTLPLAGSLYQASKLLAPAGMLLKPGGIAILAAECPDGTGPLDVVNEGIYRIGIRHYFPEAHTIYLVSSLAPEIVKCTFCRPAPSVETALWAHAGQQCRVLVLPAAGNLVPRVSE